MSVPYHVIYCDACDYRIHSLITVGNYFWRSETREARFRTGLGVCQSCGCVVAMEQFPPRQLFDQAMERRRSRMRKYLWGFGRDQIGELASKDGFEVIAEVMALRRDPVCLSCGKSLITPINRIWTENPADQTAKPLGIAHPHCGGNLWTKGSGTNRIMMAIRTQVFDIRGQRERPGPEP